MMRIEAVSNHKVKIIYDKTSIGVCYYEYFELKNGKWEQVPR